MSSQRTSLESAFNSAFLTLVNLTHSNITAQSTTDSLQFSILFNATNSSDKYDTQRHVGRSNAFAVPTWLILCYCAILLSAIVGNLLVISTLVQNRRMRTITNVFLLNLAISDILLGVFCMPVTLVGTLLRHFIFGEFFCKLIQFSQAASVAVSSWTLVAISCERYYAICHPLRSRRWQTRSHAYKIIAFIWCGSMLCMLPIAMFSQLMPTSRPGLRKCRENWPSYALPYERPYNLFLDLILLVLPLMILSVAYILITRTLYVGMRIERAMIFGGKPEDLSSSLQRKTMGGNILGKPTYSSMSLLSMNATSSVSRLKLNLSLQRNLSTSNTAKAACYNDIVSVAAASEQGGLEDTATETDAFFRQIQQHHQTLQPSAQRTYQQHNFQGHHQQHHQTTFRQRDQNQQQSHHQSFLEHEQQREFQVEQCCEPFARLCWKRSNISAANASNARPHLYCMRFATLKSTRTDNNERNPTSNFCTAGYCGDGNSGSTATINGNCNSLNTTSAIMTLSSSSTASISTTTSTMYRYHPPSHQHNHARCYCMVQQMVPQFNNKADAKKSFSNKRSLKVTESVLRRNNMAKNLESKKRVVKMLSMLVLEFFICWTPLYVINTVAMYIGSAIYEYIDYTSISVLQLLAYSSSCCNPITYCFMNANFRRAFWETFKGIHWCGKRLQRTRSTAQSGGNLCLAGSIRANSCTVQTVIDSPRL